jgi:hypothetical protein
MISTTSIPARTAPVTAIRIRASLPLMNRSLWQLAALLAIAFTGTIARAQTDDNVFGNKTPDVNQLGKRDAAVTVNGLKIISAVWGSGGHFVDVTEQVVAILKSPHNVYKANRDWLKVDPTPHWKKCLVTVYELDGVRCILNTYDNSEISVKILRDSAAEPKE